MEQTVAGCPEFDGKGIETMPVLIDSHGRYSKSIYIVMSPSNFSVNTM